jgi:hypothetical protein
LTPSAADHGAVEGDALGGAPRAREDLERFFALPRDMLCAADFNGFVTRMNPAFVRGGA